MFQKLHIGCIMPSTSENLILITICLLRTSPFQGSSSIKSIYIDWLITKTLEVANVESQDNAKYLWDNIIIHQSIQTFFVISWKKNTFNFTSICVKIQSFLKWQKKSLFIVRNWLSREYQCKKLVNVKEIKWGGNNETYLCSLSASTWV